MYPKKFIYIKIKVVLIIIKYSHASDSKVHGGLLYFINSFINRMRDMKMALISKHTNFKQTHP